MYYVCTLYAMMWENVTPFQMDKLWSQVVHYYVDKKKMSKEDANKIAAAVVKKEVEKYLSKYSLQTFKIKTSWR